MSIRDWIARMIRIEPAELSPLLQEVERPNLDQESEQRGGYDTVLQVWADNRHGSRYVSPDTAIQMATVWACVRVLAESVASLPLIVYERQERGKRRATEHPLYEVLHNRANPLMTAFEFREVMQASLVLWGNAYAQIIYNERGRILELWPLRPDRVLEIKTIDGTRLYHYMRDNGDMEWLLDVWHLRGLGSDGLVGYSPIALMRRAIGLAISAEEYGTRFLENDARPGVVLEHPGKLKEQALKNLKDSWEERHQGPSKAGRPAVLEEGMKLHEVGIPPADAQFLETRKFQVSEIARIFRIPPHMIGDLDKATFSNIEHQSLEFVVHTLRPWLVRWEQSITNNLMIERDRERFFAEFLVDGLLRGDTINRYQAYALGRQNGWLSANDIRQLENMDPVDGGDIYLIPLNMVPVEARSLGVSVETATLEKRRDERSRRSVAARYRLMQAQQRVILDVAERMVKRETADVERAVKKYYGSRDASQFIVWMEEYYLEHADRLQRAYLAMFLSYAEMIATEIEDEIETSSITDIKALVKKFVDTYLMAFAEQQVTGSMERLRETLARASQEGVNPETALLDEMEHWREVRPDEIAMEQGNKLVNAVSKVLYSAAGILYLRWFTMGDSCPYCEQLDGRKVGVSQYFIPQGEQLEGDETHEPMTITHNIGHPPAHKGCDCMISAG